MLLDMSMSLLNNMTVPYTAFQIAQILKMETLNCKWFLEQYYTAAAVVGKDYGARYHADLTPFPL